MFRDSDMSDSNVKQAQTKEDGDKLEQELLKSGSDSNRAQRRAEGDPSNSEPRMDFDRQDQAVQFVSRPRVKTDPSRDALLTTFGKATLTDRYLMPGETFQDLFARVASYYGDDEAHAQRLYD